jgi:O-antigen/teichoic acid export membrane protein
MSEIAPGETVAFEPTHASPQASASASPATVVKTIVLRFGAIGLNAVSGILTARALHAEGRGQLAAMIIWPSLLAWLTTFGLPSSLIYHLRRERERSPALVGWALVLCMAGAALGTTAAWHVLPFWLSQQPASVITAAQWCLLTTVLCSLTLLGRAAWEAEGHFGRSNFAQLLAPLTVVVGLGVVMLFGTLTPFSAAAVYVLAGLPTLVWILASVVRSFRPAFERGLQAPQQLVGYGVRSYGVDLCGAVSVYLDQALVVGLLSAESMGIYVVALSVSRILGALHSAVASMVFPKVVGLGRGEMIDAVARAARMALLASGALGLIVVIAGPTLLRWLYGPSFGAGAVILPILVCEVILSGVAFIFLQSFMAAGRPGVATMLQVTSVLVSVPIFLTLVPAFGVVGAASALLAASIIRLTLTLVSYKTVLGVPVPRVWIDGSDLAGLTRYRGVFTSSLGRLRAAGEVK